ncbi:HEAT repeat domain-containing protein [Isosphaeraceae bacterium EP7]
MSEGERPRRFGRPSRLAQLTVAMACVVPAGHVALVRGPAWHESVLAWRSAWRVELMAAKLRDTNAAERAAGLDGLITAGPVAEPWLVEAATEEDVEVRLLAIQALGRVSPTPTTAAIDALRANFRNLDVRVRRAAVDVLNRVGVEKVTRARAELYWALDDEDSEVRFHSARLLTRMETEPVEPAIWVLLELLRLPEDSTSFGRMDAVDALRLAGPRAERRAVAELITLVSSKDVSTRRSSVECLERLGPRAAEAVSALEGAMKDEDQAVRCMATLALLEIEVWEERRTRSLLVSLAGSADLPPTVSARVRSIVDSGPLKSNSKFLFRDVVQGIQIGGRDRGSSRFMPLGVNRPSRLGAMP